MPRVSAVCDILIASPSDVKNERLIVRDAIYQWNATNSRRFNAVLEPVMWETHSRSEMGDRAQALLNKQIVEACDILIAIFGTRLGSPTGNEPSGTVEEINKFLDAGKPAIIYFSTKPVDRENISDQIKKLDEYKKSLRGKGICFDFSSDEELKRLLAKDISPTISSLLKRYELSPPPKDIQGNGEYKFKMLFDTLTNFYQKLDVEWTDQDLLPNHENFMNITYQTMVKLHPVIDRAYEELWKIHGEMNNDDLNHIQSLIKLHY